MTDNFTKNKNLYLAVFLFFVFFFSLTYSLYFRIKPSVDARAYDLIAQNIASGNGYRESLNVPTLEDNSILRVGPGFEIFLAMIFFIFGHYYIAVWIIQAVLHALTAFLVFIIARKIFFGHKERDIIGFISALFIGLSPDLITISGMLMAETLGVFLVALTLFMFFKSLDGERISYLGTFITGAVFGMATLARTPAMLLFLPIAAYFLVKNRIRHLIIFGVTALLVFSPWIIRNYIVYQTFIPTNLAYGIDLAAGNHSGASGELEPYSRNDEVIAQYGKIAGTRQLTKEAISFIFNNPGEFLKITANRISIYFSFARPTGFWFHLSGISQMATLALSSIYSALLFIFGFLGIWFYLNNKASYGDRALWLLYMAIMMPLTVIFIMVETRYRFLIYPPLSIFAGIGVSALFGGLISRRNLFIIPALLLSNTFLDILRNIDRILDRISFL